jgi:hypothetical protein
MIKGVPGMPRRVLTREPDIPGIAMDAYDAATTYFSNDYINILNMHRSLLTTYTSVAFPTVYVKNISKQT